MKTIDSIKKDLKQLSDPTKIVGVSKFFKTGKGEYGEDDIFAGIKVPDQRKVVTKHYKSVTLEEVESLLQNKIHEYRLCALFFLVKLYTINEDVREEIVNIFITNLEYVNNWDLVDSSAHKILGEWLLDKDRSIIYDLANSGELWKERVAVMTTFCFIKNKDYKDNLILAEKFLTHKHDLIHKAVGWMLREIGNRNLEIELKFLNIHYKKMPRTMLRYAIEKFETPLRKAYLNGNI